MQKSFAEASSAMVVVRAIKSSALGSAQRIALDDEKAILTQELLCDQALETYHRAAEAISLREKENKAE